MNYIYIYYMTNKYGYVTLLYGNNNYFLGTLIFIISLMKTKPKYDTILLYTFDVPKYMIDILKKYYKIVRQITYVNIKKTSRKRFKEIFTKLKIFTITDYDKILFLDNDMYVNKNLDHIFDKYDAPAGMALSEDLKYSDLEKVKDKNVIFNAGCWLIKPSNSVYKNLLYGLKKFNTNQELEQEYVSYYFNGKWTNMSYLYNYQFNLASLNSNMRRTQVYKNTKMEDCYIIHYSTSLKPWNLLFDTSIFNKNKLIRIYWQFYKLWLQFFIKVYNIYLKDNINILNLRLQLKDFGKYLKKVYPNMKILKLTDIQKDKLFTKLNTEITNTSKTNNKYTYNDIIKVLNKGENTTYIVGGAIRNLYNDDEINDIDLCYDILPDKLEKVLKNNFIDLNFIRGKILNSYYKIGNGKDELDMFYIDFLDKYRNMPANYLILDTKKNIVYDSYGTGIKNANKKIFIKPPDLSYNTWLTYDGYSNNILGRLIKFMLLGYKTYQKDRVEIYNDWYFIKNDKQYYRHIKKFLKEDREFKYKFIQNDIDKLNLKFSGKQFIHKLKLKIN